jgi:hypothetical protein
LLCSSSLLLLLLWLSLLLSLAILRCRVYGGSLIIFVVIVVVFFVSEAAVSVTGKMGTPWLSARGTGASGEWSACPGSVSTHLKTSYKGSYIHTIAPRNLVFRRFRAHSDMNAESWIARSWMYVVELRKDSRRSSPHMITPDCKR